MYNYIITSRHRAITRTWVHTQTSLLRRGGDCANSRVTRIARAPIDRSGSRLWYVREWIRRSRGESLRKQSNGTSRERCDSRASPSKRQKSRRKTRVCLVERVTLCTASTFSCVPKVILPFLFHRMSNGDRMTRSHTHTRIEFSNATLPTLYATLRAWLCVSYLTVGRIYNNWTNVNFELF